MKGKLFRLGHMGYYADDDIIDLVTALEATLTDLGWIESGDAGAAATAELNAQADASPGVV